MAYSLSDKNFKNLQTKFKEDTGLDATTNMETYIAYYHARMSDSQMQMLGFILEEIAKKK